MENVRLFFLKLDHIDYFAVTGFLPSEVFFLCSESWLLSAMTHQADIKELKVTQTKCCIALLSPSQLFSSAKMWHWEKET